MVEKLKEIKNKIAANLSTYSEMKKEILEDEYLALIGDASKVVTFLRGVSKIIVNKKFQKFLEGFSEGEQPLEEQMDKLLNYIDDEEKAEFISDIFTKVMLANSSKATLVMGTILKDIEKAGSQIEHNKIIAINALTTMYDIDLKNIMIINEFFELESDRIYPPRLAKYCSEKCYDYNSVNLTIEKCVSYQILNVDYLADVRRSIGRTGASNSPIHPHFFISEPGKQLVGYIKRIA